MDTTGRGRPSKVIRLIERYDLEGIGAELEAEWTKEDSDRMSLRKLAAYFNRELLRAALRNAGVKTVDGEVANFYRLLTDEDASAADRTRVRRRLEQKGVDVEEVQSEFVSYQAIRTYLQNHRNATYDADDNHRLAGLQTTVTQLQNRLVTVTESRLKQVNGSEIEIGDPNVIANVQLNCTACGRRFSVDELSEGVTCDCSEP